MKYLFIGVFTLLCLFACQSNDSQYIIEGTLPTAQQDGEWIYLAPMENASIENIDSTRIENARFTFQGTGEEMKVLRMRILLRLKFQCCKASFCGVPEAELMESIRTEVTPGSVTTSNSWNLRRKLLIMRS